MQSSYTCDSSKPALLTVDFEDLTRPEVNQELLAQISNRIKGCGWSDTHQCITMIRSILKFSPESAPELFQRYGLALLEGFSSSTPLNVKNILKLLKQIFAHGRALNLEAIVAAFLAPILRKAVSECGQIKQGCQQILTLISQTCGYMRVLQTLAQLSCDKNSAVAEVALKLLAVICANIGADVTKLDGNTLSLITKALSFLINGKRNTMRINALDICVFLVGQMGVENYLHLMEFSLGSEEKEAMKQAMEQHRVQKQKEPHLSDMLRSYRKDQASRRRSGVWNHSSL